MPNLILSVPALVGVMLFTFVGQLLMVSRFPDMTSSELAWIVISIACYALLLTVVTGVAGAIAAGRQPGFRAAAVWMMVVLAASLHVADYAGYLWLGLHLHETFPLIVENMSSFQTTMRSKMGALTALLVVAAAAFVAGMLGLRYVLARGAPYARRISPRRALAWVAALALLVGVERVLTPHVLGVEAYEAKNRALWQPHIYAPRHPAAAVSIVEIEAPRFRQVPSEKDVVAALSQLSPADIRQSKNIFFFVIDSLREDAITEEVAPNLHALKQRSLPVGAGVAASNVTHISWFSLLHAVNPLYWSVTAHQEHSNGAVPLRVLNQCGYRINALSCSSLEYFGFERSVFGDSPSLAAKVIDARALFDPATDGGEGDVDQKVMIQLTADVAKLRPDSRAFYLIMLDSTHHDYSWARGHQPKFRPFSELVSVFTQPRADEIEPLRNRYKNAVNFVDALFGQFMTTLEAKGLLDHSIVVVTGDHGEEFFERGHLVHSGELNRFQTRTPILISVPGVQAPPTGVGAHIDIFPTIFDALGLRTKTQPLFEGMSLLEEAPHRAAFCVMASSYSPSEAIVDGGDYKLFLELDGVRKVGRTLFARRLTASKLLDRDDRVVAPSQEITRRFRPALRRLVANDLGF